MINMAFYKYEYGFLKIGYTETAIVEIRQTERADSPDEHSVLSDRAFCQIRDYLDGRRRAFDIPLELHGTRFQKAVWDSLLQIPYGETRTYKELASAVGNSKASRAAGMANGKNPLMIVVPCHRVIGTNGTLTGYAGGLAMKKALLELERKENWIHGRNPHPEH